MGVLYGHVLATSKMTGCYRRVVLTSESQDDIAVCAPERESDLDPVLIICAACVKNESILKAAGRRRAIEASSSAHSLSRRRDS